MNRQEANAKTVTRFLFRLLPIQIILAAVGSVNGIVSSFFASNYVGITAMSAVGLYSPLNMLITSISLILVGGFVILCGKYMGENQQEKTQTVFSQTLVFSLLIAGGFMTVYAVLGLLDLTGFLTQDMAVRPLFNRYMLGQVIGIIPLMLGNTLAAFLSLENKGRQTLTDVMRVMFRRFIPLMCAVCTGIVLCAVPLTGIFYRNPAEPVYMMTVWGLRILPLSMPLSIICMHFTCYGQAFGKHGLVHLLSLLDGVVCVVAFTAMLIRAIGMNSVYIANVLNGIVTTLVIFGYAIIKNRRFPRNMEELMVIPEDFGVLEEERMDLSITSMEEVVSVSERVQNFCISRGIDDRRAHLAGLFMEEMAGNVVDHGFRKDSKPDSVDIRVAHKNDEVILRIRDDCIPFDPGERRMLTDPEDLTKNIGIRMVYKIARNIEYQNILGLNVLTIRI